MIPQIKFFIKHQNDFLPFLDKRGGLQPGDICWHTKMNELCLITKLDKITPQNIYITTLKSNIEGAASTYLDLIWQPSTDDLIEIKKLQNNHTDKFGWQWILATPFVPAKIWISSTSLREALARWVVKQVNIMVSIKIKKEKKRKIVGHDG